MSEFTIYNSGAGYILLQDDVPIAWADAGEKLFQKAGDLGAKSVATNDDRLVGPAKSAGLEGSIVDEARRAALDSRKIELMVSSGLVRDQATALQLIRERSIAAAEEAIRKASSRPDLQLVQAIQALDETDKYLNIVATRASEWYGLHFPELTQMMQDNVALCRMISEVGGREKYTEDTLRGRGLSDKKVEAILEAASRSKGGEISEGDLSRVQTLAGLAVQLSAEREKLNSYVEGAMRRISPNVADVAGSTIGARLMAKAGGLDRLAVLPASTIQILGAEKALFRALRTGARPPKHGILFQHTEVHMAPKWQRGKIARTLANKIAIAARVDCYRGSEDLSLKEGLDKRLQRIKEKYKEPPKRPPVPERRRFQRPQRQEYRKKSRHR